VSAEEKNCKFLSFDRITRFWGDDRPLAHGLWGEGLVWLIDVLVCLCAAPWVLFFCITGNGWPHNAPQYHQLMPISCHFRDCKAVAGHETD